MCRGFRFRDLGPESSSTAEARCSRSLTVREARVRQLRKLRRCVAEGTPPNPRPTGAFAFRRRIDRWRRHDHIAAFDRQPATNDERACAGTRSDGVHRTAGDTGVDAVKSDSLAFTMVVPEASLSARALSRDFGAGSARRFRVGGTLAAGLACALASRPAGPSVPASVPERVPRRVAGCTGGCRAQSRARRC